MTIRIGTQEIEHEELFTNDWLSLRRTPDGYVYSHETRCEGEIVAILVHDEDGQHILGRFEITPAHGPEKKLVSITGGVEKGERPVVSAVRELKEEAGIDATPEELIDLGTVRPSKSADTVVHLFGLDASKKDIGDAEGDGSPGEEGAYCDWVKTTAAAGSSDPLVAAMLLRLALRHGGHDLETDEA